jgi:hypothetical protein
MPVKGGFDFIDYGIVAIDSYSPVIVRRGTHADRTHSPLGLLNLLLDFVKKVYTSSTERHSTPPVAPAGSPSLPLAAASDDLLTSVQPATKIIEDLESKIGEAQLSALAESKNGKSTAHEQYVSSYLHVTIS